jgi:hypothetical protein
MVGKPRRWFRVALATLGASALLFPLLWLLNADAPLRDSCATQYLTAAALAASFVAASWSAGLSIVRWLVPARLKWEERLTVGFALGVLLFYTCVFVAGVLGVLNRGAAIAVPLLLLAVGAPSLLRLARQLRRARRQRGAPPVKHHVAISCIGAATLLFFFGQALSSSTIGYDSSWYHLPVAEAYAAQGAIRPFREGWMLGAYPQLASVLYAWCLVIAHETALGWTTCAFLELALALAAIFGLVPLVRALTPGAGRAGWAWCAIALFPAVYLYSPHLEADYAAASFTPALLLIAFKLWDRVDRRMLMAGALLLAALLLVKYTAVSAAAFPLLLVGGGIARELWRARASFHDFRFRLGAITQSVALATGVFGVATASHWLKNWIAYGDPLFPNLSTKPFSPATLSAYKEVLLTLWQPPPGAEGWWQTARALGAFSFEPKDYSWYNDGHPIFGSLFTLTLPALLLLSGLRRVLALHLGTLLGVMIWFRLHHQDRYLLVLLPAMCAVTAATLRALWRVGTLPRLLVVMACSVQLLWGFRWALHLFPFDAVRSAVWSPTVESWRTTQTNRAWAMCALGRKLRPGKILMHSTRLRLGLRHDSLTDSLGYQTRLSFAELATDRRVYDELKALGVSQLYAPSPGDGLETLGGELVFRGFFERWGRPTDESSVRLMPLERPPAKDPAERLAFVDACEPTSAGLYRVGSLTSLTNAAPTGLPAPVSKLEAGDAAPLLKRAEFLVSPTNCDWKQLKASTDGFKLLVYLSGARLYLRASN